MRNDSSAHTVGKNKTQKAFETAGGMQPVMGSLYSPVQSTTPKNTCIDPEQTRACW